MSSLIISSESNFNLGRMKALLFCISGFIVHFSLARIIGKPQLENLCLNAIGLWNPKHKRKTLRKTSTLEITISFIKAFCQVLAQCFSTIS